MTRFHTIAFICSATMLVAGCQPQNLRPDPDDNRHSMTELEQRADRAYNRDDWQTAEQAYRKLTQMAPAEADPWFRLGNVYTYQGRAGAALTAYHEALARDPEHARAWYNMGLVQLRQASISFANLQETTADEDPLNRRARVLLETMTQLMESDFGAGAEGH